MDHLDHRPKRHKNHRIQAAAERAFEDLLSQTDDLIVQGTDRADYGTDVQVEVVDGEDVTNVRIHVQLKGTEAELNADGSVSVSVRRATVNYLLVQPYSIFVCYHLPTGNLRISSVDAVVRKYEHEGRVWTNQETVTVTFLDPLTLEKLTSLADLAKSEAATARDARFAQMAARTKDVASLMRAAPPQIHVPDQPAQAATLLQDLYHSDRSDEAISAAFDRFQAVLGPDHDAMTYGYMSEINLGLAGASSRPDRIVEGIPHLERRVDGGKLVPSGLHYCIGNAYSALAREAEAVQAFERALECWSPTEDDGLRAQIYKNLGTSHERLGDPSRAVELFKEALASDPNLPEAHSALGFHALQNGEYAGAIAHLDQAVFPGGQARSRAMVSGWRLNALFNLGDGKAAFREISNLLTDAEDQPWIWPWCARQVAAFGRANGENASLSLPFWDRYLKANPDCPSGTRERLLNQLYLRQGDDYRGPDYAAFKPQFEAGIDVVQGDQAAYLWDRLGHWAQDEEDWSEAERCFRHAYDLGGGHYGYCLGTALNFLDRPEKALPLLIEQVEREQPDAMSWSQLASAYAGLGRTAEGVSAYRKAIALNAENGHAWFNLGGLYWNSGDFADALATWSEALERFPDHELGLRLRQDFPFFA